MKRVSSTIVFALLIVVFPQFAHSVVLTPAHSLIAVDQTSHEEELRIFAGTIVLKEGGKFFLLEQSTQTLYALDDQALASKFADKKVLVTGSIDKTGIIRDFPPGHKSKRLSASFPNGIAIIAQENCKTEMQAAANTPAGAALADHMPTRTECSAARFTNGVT